MCRRPPDEHGNIFTEEEIENIGNLCVALKQIRIRLIREGIDIDAEFKKLDTKKSTPSKLVR